MAVTALERLRGMRKEESATGVGLETAWPLPADVCPVEEAMGDQAAEWSKDYSQPAADVLAVLLNADTPLLHTALVAALADLGHGKAAACKAIADVQGKGWIEHNLVSGYVLAGGEE